MSLNYNNVVLGSAPNIINMKFQFDCRKFYDTEPLVYSSDPALLPVAGYNKTSHYFQAILDKPDYLSILSIQATSLILTPPINAAGVPYSSSAGFRDLWVNVEGDAITIGAQTNTAATGRLPELVCLQLVLVQVQAQS